MTLLQPWRGSSQAQTQRRRKLPRRQRAVRLSLSHTDLLIYEQLGRCFCAFLESVGVESAIPEPTEGLSARATLIVTQLSVLSNWMVRLLHSNTHVKTNKITLPVKSFCLHL